MPRQISKRFCACARSPRFISSQRSAPRAICSCRCGSSSAQRCSCGASNRRCASVKSCHATPCALAVPANASNTIEIATSLFAFMVVISLSLGLFGVFGTLDVFGTLRVLGVGPLVFPLFFDCKPLVVPFGPGAEILEKIQVGRRGLCPRRLSSSLSLLRVRSREPATCERERRPAEGSHQPTLSTFANSGCSSSQP